MKKLLLVVLALALIWGRSEYTNAVRVSHARLTDAVSGITEDSSNVQKAKNELYVLRTLSLTCLPVLECTPAEAIHARTLLPLVIQHFDLTIQGHDIKLAGEQAMIQGEDIGSYRVQYRKVAREAQGLYQEIQPRMEQNLPAGIGEALSVIE